MRVSITPSHPIYKWYVLILGMLSFFTVAGVSRMCMPVLFKQISIDLDLSMVAIGTVWGMDPLAGVVIALPGGLLVDRFGVRKTLVVVCLFAGIFGALRGLAFNFGTMAVSMFLFGLMAASAPSIVPKAAGMSFKGKQLNMANALLNTAWALGSMSATMLSATVFAVWFGGWRPVLYVYAVPCVILAGLWLTIGKERTNAAAAGKESTPKVSFKKALSHVTRIRSVWLLGAIGFSNFGAAMALLGYLPLYLRNMGWSPTLADSAMTMTNGVSILGILPIVVLANRVRSPKAILFIAIAVMTITYFAIPLVDGHMIWLVLFVNGMLRNTLFTLMTIMIFEMRSVGPKFSGTALGLMNSFGMLGAFIAPPIGNSLTSYSSGTPFIFWGIFSAIALPVFLFVKADRM